MKKVIICTAVIILIFLLPACGKAKVYRFLNPSDEITEIAIVNVSSAEGDNLTETEILRGISKDWLSYIFRRPDKCTSGRRKKYGHQNLLPKRQLWTDQLEWANRIYPRKRAQILCRIQCV